MNLTNIPEWHIEKCHENSQLTKWWYRIGTGPKGKAWSNIRIGDIFTLGLSKQLGIVHEKTIVGQNDVPPKITYGLSGRLGGSWVRPDHRDIVELGFFQFIPSATQLMELDRIEGNSRYRSWWRDLVEHYLGSQVSMSFLRRDPSKDMGVCQCGGLLEKKDKNWAWCPKCGDDGFPISAEAAGYYDPKKDPCE